jgi:hypothetical protein
MPTVFEKMLAPVLLGLAASCAAAQPVATTEVAAAGSGTSPLTRVASEPIGANNADRVKLRWEALPGGFARAVAVSRGLGRVVFSSEQNSQVFDLASGRPLGKLHACDDVVRGGLFFHASKLLVVCRQSVEWHDVAELERLAPLEVNAAPITAASLVGDRLALAHHDGVVRVYDLVRRSIVEIVVPGPPIDVKSLALDPQAARVALAWTQGSIWWWSLAQPDVFHKLVRNESESDSVAFAPDGTFAEEGRPGYTTLWQLGENGEGRLKQELRNGAWIKRLLFTRDSAWLIRGGSDGLELAELGGARRLTLDSAGQVEDVALDEAGSLIASGDRQGRLMFFGVP